MFQQAIENYLTTHHFDKLNLKAVLFDMDGVLFDSMKNHAAAWHEAMKQYGMHLSPEEAYMHEGRTGASTINIVSTRQRHREATEEEIKEIYQTKSDIFNSFLRPNECGSTRTAQSDKGRQFDSSGSNRLRTEIIAGTLEQKFSKYFQRRAYGNSFRCKIWKAQSGTLSDGTSESRCQSQ